MFKKFLIAVLMLAFFVVSVRAVASETPKEGELAEESQSEKTSDKEVVDIKAIPPILDPEYRHNKKNQMEFVVFGGSYLANSMGQTWLVGGKLYYWFNNTIGIGSNYSYSRLITNTGNPFGGVLRDPNMHAMDVEIILNNDAALRVGKTMIQMDFFATLGMGTMYLNGFWEPMGNIGGGVKFYTGIPWLAFRIDMNAYVHNVSQPGRDVVDFDMIITGGFSFMFPSRRTPFEQK